MYGKYFEMVRSKVCFLGSWFEEMRDWITLYKDGSLRDCRNPKLAEKLHKNISFSYFTLCGEFIKIGERDRERRSKRLW